MIIMIVFIITVVIIILAIVVAIIISSFSMRNIAYVVVSSEDRSAKVV